LVVISLEAKAVLNEAALSHQDSLVSKILRDSSNTSTTAILDVDLCHGCVASWMQDVYQGSRHLTGEYLRQKGRDGINPSFFFFPKGKSFLLTDFP
jgi:hypothetical protein